MNQDSAELLTRRLNWNLLKTFYVLAKSTSITDAADQLYLRQPSVSHSLKQLETLMGKRLIDRSPGHYELTEAGKKLHREVVDIYGAILRLDTVMREVEEVIRGHVQIAAASHVVSPLFDKVLADFHAAHPFATLSIDVGASKQAVAAVQSQRATMAICLMNHPQRSLEQRMMFREFFGLYCGPTHELYGRGDLTLRDLAGQRSVSFSTDQMSDALRKVAIMRAQANLDDHFVARSSHLEEVRRLIIAGLGIGPLPNHVVKRDLEDGTLWRLPPYDDPPAVDVHLLWNPKAKLNRAETAMLTMLVERIDATPLEDRVYR